MKSEEAIDWGQRDLRHVWHPCSQMKDYESLPPIVLERAKGVYLYDMEGKAYMDIISSWWCNLLGHNHPRLSHALVTQLGRMEHAIFANFTHRPAIELCEHLATLLPSSLTKFFFTDNGSAAIEAAMKMSFQFHAQSPNEQDRKRVKFMALENAYHGETLGALSAGGVDLYSALYKPLLLDVVRTPAPDCFRCPHSKTRATCQAECFSVVEPFFATHGATTTAFLVEPLLQAAAGMRIYPPIFLQKLRHACTQHGIHLIADEIATGFGRTGTMFACQQAAITPDFICLSKGLTGGYMPMAIVAATQEIYDAFYDDYGTHKAFLHSHTYSGNPMACALALEVLRTMQQEEILAQANALAPRAHQILCDALADHHNVGEIRQLGLINAIELVADKKTKTPFPSELRVGYQIYKQALQRGLLLRPLGDVLYFNPPLTITESEWQHATKICQQAIVSCTTS